MNPTSFPIALMRLSPDKLIQQLTRSGVAHPNAVDIQPLAGDASTRCYFRLNLTVEQEPRSLMAMQLEKPETDDLDWLVIQSYLQELDLPVPKVYEYIKEDGVLILEDLGDLTLEASLSNASRDQVESAYDQAVDLLATLQHRATIKKTPAFERRFDVEKLMWEFNFMLEHFAGGYLGHAPSASLHATLQKEMTALCARLEAIEPCYCHRDYHSRNLMVRGDELVMIDFQDARLGPPQYDLVSLLCDAYRPLPGDMIQRKTDRFIQKKEALENQPIDRQAFNAGFDLMVIQRGLKAIGTFAFQKTMKDNPRYEQYIAPTLVNVKQALDRHPDELAELKAALEEALPPLQQTNTLP